MRLWIALTTALAVGPSLFGGSLFFDNGNFSVNQLNYNAANGGGGSTIGEFSVSNSAVGLGFINVLDSSNNWLVQNLYVGLEATGTISQRFNIASTAGTIFEDNLKVDFSTTPLFDTDGITGNAIQNLNVVALTLAIGGTGDNINEDGVTTPAGIVSFIAGGANSVKYQANHPNVEAAINQCAPAAVANSLTWLGVATTPNNPGSFGVPDDPAKPSLVARLDTLMGRLSNQCPPASPGPPPVPAGPCGVWPLDGKLQYLNSIGASSLRVNFQDAADNPVNDAGNGGRISGLPANTDYQSGGAGITAKNNGTPTFDFIQSELIADEDVEIDIRFPCPTVANPAKICRHYVEVTGAGTILGKQWITHISDQNQGVAGGNTSTQFDWVTGANGLPGWGAGAQIDQVISESTPEPGTLALIGLGLLALLGARKYRTS